MMTERVTLKIVMCTLNAYTRTMAFGQNALQKHSIFFKHAYFQKSWVTGILGLVVSPRAAVMMNNQVAVRIQKIKQLKISMKTVMIVTSQDIATVVVHKQAL